MQEVIQNLSQICLQQLNRHQQHFEQKFKWNSQIASSSQNVLQIWNSDQIFQGSTVYKHWSDRLKTKTSSLSTILWCIWWKNLKFCSVEQHFIVGQCFIVEHHFIVEQFIVQQLFIAGQHFVVERYFIVQLQEKQDFTVNLAEWIVEFGFIVHLKDMPAVHGFIHFIFKHIQEYRHDGPTVNWTVQKKLKHF